MRYLFIDESGDHNLNLHKIDPSFPLFVLTGVTMTKETYLKFCKVWKQMKIKCFGNEKTLIHTLELVRPQKAKQATIRNLSDPVRRKLFYKEINTILKITDYRIIAFVIRKPEFSKIFPEHYPDPYFLSFSYIIGEYVNLLSSREGGVIEAEKRNSILDKQFILSWELASKSRVGLVTREELVKHKLLKPNLYNKSYTHPGLELADMLSYRLSRAIMNKPIKAPGNEVDLHLVNRNLKLGALPA